MKPSIEDCRGRSLRLLALGALLLPIGDRSYRLNDRFLKRLDGDVREFELSPDGTRLAYWAHDQAEGLQLFGRLNDGLSDAYPLTDFSPGDPAYSPPVFTPDGTRIVFKRVTGIWSVPADGSAPPVRLGTAIPFQVTPDSARVLFRGEISNDRYGLFSVPIDGSAPAIVVNSPMPAAQADVEEFLVGPDDSRVVYRADANVAGRYELFTAFVDVAASGVVLNGAMPSGGNVLPGFRISADGARAVYLADQVTDGVVELFSAPLDASAAAIRLNPPLPGQSDVVDFVLSPDGARVVYRTDRLSGPLELHSVPIDGSAGAVQLHAPLSGAQDVEADYVVSADDARVVFRADLLVVDRVDLYSVPIDGSAAPLWLDGLVDGNVQAGFALAPNGARAAFVADPAGAAALFSVPLDGSAAPLVLDGDARPMSELAIGGNSARVLYRRSDPDGDHLWSAPLGGGAAAVQLSSGNGLGHFRATPNGVGVSYTADPDRAGVFELFGRTASGSTSPTQLSLEFTNFVPNGRVYSYQPGLDHVLYWADDPATGVKGVFHVPVSGRGAPLLVSATTGAPIDVTTTPPSLGAGGTRAVFSGRTASLDELYSAPIDGSAQPLVLSGPSQQVFRFVLSPDGSRAVYLAGPSGDVYRAELDVAASPVQLSVSGSVLDFLANADGSRVIYTANRDALPGNELYSADGLTAPVKISGATGSVPTGVLLSQDGAWAFYRSDPNVSNRFELFRAPSDGSASQIALSGTIVAGGNVTSDFRVTPDGATALFRANREVVGDVGLYSVPSDGSTSPRKLDPGNGGVEGFLLDPSATVVVFLYRRNGGPGPRLLRAPSDGSSPAISLAPDHEAQQGWFQISPDGARVVYRAGSNNLLYSVPIDASAPPVKLGQYVREFRIDPLGQRVAYAADLAGGAKTVCLVPIDGSQAPVRLTSASDALQGGLRFALDGSAVLYLTDPRGPGFYDLYATLVERVPRPGNTPTLR